MKLEKIYDQLKKRCAAAGIDLTQLCNEAVVDRSILERWKQKDPKTVQILNQLDKALVKFEKLVSKRNDKPKSSTQKSNNAKIEKRGFNQ